VATGPALMAVGATSLAREIKDSPLVGRPTENLTMTEFQCRLLTRILLVEDDDRQARMMCNGLSGAGIAADVMARIDAAWAAIQQIPYWALVLDRGLPDGDGPALLRRLRASEMGIACLMLTARDALDDRVEGLEAGADDYLPKPFAMDEFVARVRGLLRRPTEQCQLDLAAGDLLLRPQTGVMQCATETVTLSAAEMQIMLLLLRAGGDTVRRSALEVAAWGLLEAVTPNAFAVVLHRLRRKMLAIGSRQRILTLRSLGYALRDG
jgi:DNA-binding response OmpR family regulator